MTRLALSLSPTRRTIQTEANNPPSKPTAGGHRIGQFTAGQLTVQCVDVQSSLLNVGRFIQAVFVVQSRRQCVTAMRDCVTHRHDCTKSEYVYCNDYGVEAR